MNKERCDVWSIPNFCTQDVSHGARHGPTERQRIQCKAHNMLKKDAEERVQHHIGKIPKKILSIEIHGLKLDGMRTSYLHTTKSQKVTNPTMRREEKEAGTKTRQNSNSKPRLHMDHWIREMTTRRRRRHATGCTRSMQQVQDAATHQFIHNNKYDKWSNQQFKGYEEDSYRLDSSGWRYYVPATMNSSPSSSSSRWQTSDSWWAWNWDS